MIFQPETMTWVIDNFSEIVFHDFSTLISNAKFNEFCVDFPVPKN